MIREEILKHRESNSVALKYIPLTSWNRVDYRLEERENYTLLQTAEIKSENALVKEITFDRIEADSRFELDKYINEVNRIYLNAGNVIESTKNKGLVRMSYNATKENPHIIDYNLIKVNEGQSLTVVLDYTSVSDVKSLRNSVYKVEVEENGELEIVFVQRMALDSDSFAQVVIDQKAYSKVKEYFIDLGAFGLGSSNKIYLGESATSETYSIYLADGERKIDLEFSNFHKGRRSESLIEGRGIVKDKAKKVFRGNLKFERGSAKSVGRESEFAILLDKTVKASSIPTLKCDEDDVLGEHAASAGQIDKNKLFYLMSRGLSAKDAEKLIVLSNFKPVLDKINDEELEKLVLDEIEKRV